MRLFSLLKAKSNTGHSPSFLSVAVIKFPDPPPLEKKKKPNSGKTGFTLAHSSRLQPIFMEKSDGRILNS